MVPSPFHMGDDDDSGGLLHFSNATREGKWRAKGCWLSVALNVALVITTIVLASSSSRTHHSSACTDSSATAELVSTQLGAVAADEARCSDIGAAVLDDGGNAIDAAVAATLCLGVTHPQSSGIGGGAFIVLRLANGTSEAINSRESAPAAAYRDMYVDDSNRSSVFGGAAVAVPTELSGLRLAWERHGSLPWKQLVLPAAELADGFEVGKDLALSIAAQFEALATLPATAAVFLRGGTRALEEGEICRNPQLAATLRRVADEGPDALRVGPLAEALAADIRDAGGDLFAAADLSSEAASAKVLAPLVAEGADMFGMGLIGMPPPSSGGAAVAMVLQFLGGAWTAEGGSGNKPLASAGPLGTHRTVEAFKHAFALRMSLGDPDALAAEAEAEKEAEASSSSSESAAASIAANATKALADMLSPSFSEALRAATKDDATLPFEAYGGKWNQLDDAGTTHLSIVDAAGNAVALTSTINTAFGSKVVSPSTGILLNNEMDDFSSPGQAGGNSYGLPPSEANFISPGKRPLSSMAPTIVTDTAGRSGSERVIAVAGASGGPRIITATAQVLLNVIAKGMAPLEAVNAPRWHHQLVPHTAFAEDQHCLGDTADPAAARKVSSDDVAALRARGHEVERSGTRTAVTQLIVVEYAGNETSSSSSSSSSSRGGGSGRTVHAVSDARKGGRPAAQHIQPATATDPHRGGTEA